MHQFIDALKTKLFEAEERRLTAGIDRIVEQHEEIKGPSLMQFMFNGEVYRHSKANTIHKSVFSLAWELNGEMEKWLKDRKTIDLDRDQIGQMLYRLQSHVMQGYDGTRQEVRDALPECLVSLVPVFQNLPRRMNTQFFLRSDRDFRQYAKILPKIEMYAMTKLIY
jgi:hypothetical protein